MKTMTNTTTNEIIENNSRGNIKMKKFTKLFKNQKGLTLIELLAVIVILAIVAAIATPAIGKIIEKSNEKAILADASSILSGAKIALLDNACGVADTNGAIECTSTELVGFVEGISGTFSATKAVSTTTTGWTVNYSKLGTENTAGWTILPTPVVTNSAITEEALITALGK
jgi:type IV pilus assembly protein PilA